MKRTHCLILSLLLILSLAGCRSHGSLRSPAVFYYPREEYVFGSREALFGAEAHESSGLTLDTLLSQYLQGPRDLTLTCTIPDGTAVVSVVSEGSVITVTLTDSFADLTGIDMTLACAGLARTLLEHTGAQSIILRAQTMQLDGHDQILMDAESIHYFDNTDVSSTDASVTEEQ